MAPPSSAALLPTKTQLSKVAAEPLYALKRAAPPDSSGYPRLPFATFEENTQLLNTICSGAMVWSMYSNFVAPPPPTVVRFPRNVLFKIVYCASSESRMYNPPPPAPVPVQRLSTNVTLSQ